jgi:uncharacterized protein (TIGR03067 family)
MSDLATATSALAGRWQAIYQELEGESADHDDIIEFDQNTFKIEKSGSVEYEGSFSVGGERAPFSMVLFYSRSPKAFFLGGPRPGIFQVEGDTFKCCFGAIGHPAPTVLNSYPGSASVLTIFRRIAPAGQPAAQAAVATSPAAPLPGHPPGSTRPTPLPPGVKGVDPW